MSDDLEVLKEISKKLDQLIILSKLNNRDLIKDYKEKIRSDKVSNLILDYADDSLAYSELVEKVMKKQKVGERTVKGRIAKLKEMGFLVSRRQGREVYYEKSDLFE